MAQAVTGEAPRLARARPEAGTPKQTFGLANPETAAIDGHARHTIRFGSPRANPLAAGTNVQACRGAASGTRFPHFGINVHLLEPGEPNAVYHSETAQKAFLVLPGEWTLVVEETDDPRTAYARAGRAEHRPLPWPPGSEAV